VCGVIGLGGNYKKWSDSDVLFLKVNLDKLTTKAIADRLGRTSISVRNKTKKLGLVVKDIKHSKSGKFIWTEDAENVVRCLYGKESSRVIGKKLGVSKQSVVHRARLLGLSVDKESAIKLTGRTFWTDDMMEEVKTRYLKEDKVSIAKDLGVSVYALDSKAYKLGMRRGNYKWSKQDEEYLVKMWGRELTSSIAEDLGIPLKTVLVKANNMKLGRQVSSGGSALSVYDIASILGMGNVKVYSLIKKGYIRTKRFTLGGMVRHKISIGSFVDFLKMYQDLYDTRESDLLLVKAYCSKVVHGNKGVSVEEVPFWLSSKIESDKNNRSLRVRRMWTTGEEHELKNMLVDGKSYEYIAGVLGRTKHSIESRVKILGLMDKRAVWTHDECVLLSDMIDKGYSVKYISMSMGRSVHSVGRKLRKLGKASVGVEVVGGKTSGESGLV